MGVGEQRIGVVLYQPHLRERLVRLQQEGSIKLVVDGRCAGQHKLIVRELTGHLHHGRQVLLDLLLTTASQ